MKLARVIVLSAAVVLPTVFCAASGSLASSRANPLVQQAADPLLELLPGEWRGEQQAGGVELLEKVSWEWVLDHQFLECRMETIDPLSGNVVYRGRGFLRHDADSSEYTLHWFDSNGVARSYSGAASGDVLVLGRSTPDGRETLRFTREADSYRCSARRTVPGGSEQPLFESSYRRVQD